MHCSYHAQLANAGKALSILSPWRTFVFSSSATISKQDVDVRGVAVCIFLGTYGVVRHQCQIGHFSYIYVYGIVAS